MTIGAGIAIAGIWIGCAITCCNERVGSGGMLITLLAATICTFGAVLP